MALGFILLFIINFLLGVFVGLSVITLLFDHYYTMEPKK